MKILAIDPGHVQSAYVWWDSSKEIITEKGIVPNDTLLSYIEARPVYAEENVAIEMLASFGMPVGREVFETALWIGKFIHAFGKCEVSLVYRQDIKMHLCHSMRAKDSNIRQALVDRFGDPGTKKAAGKLYGVKADIWSALAVAVFYADTRKENAGIA